MWIAVEDYLAVGGHDVRIALDFADHEFIERFKRRHDRFVVVNAECIHNFFRVTEQSTASHWTRFRYYCQGAGMPARGPWTAYSRRPRDRGAGLPALLSTRQPGIPSDRGDDTARPGVPVRIAAEGERGQTVRARIRSWRCTILTTRPDVDADWGLRQPPSLHRNTCHLTRLSPLS